MLFAVSLIDSFSIEVRRSVFGPITGFALFLDFCDFLVFGISMAPAACFSRREGDCTIYFLFP